MEDIKEMNQFINDKFISFSSVLDQTIGHTDFILNIFAKDLMFKTRKPCVKA